MLAALGAPVTPDRVAQICFARFAPPLAPNVAMRRAGMTQDFAAIRAFAARSVPDTPAGLHLIEGAGGVMSPVTDDKLHLDLIEDLDLPVILVAAGYLGAVSHTLTALTCLEARAIPVAALIVSQPTAEAEPPQHLIDEVKRWSDVTGLALPYLAGGERVLEGVDGPGPRRQSVRSIRDP